MIGNKKVEDLLLLIDSCQQVLYEDCETLVIGFSVKIRKGLSGTRGGSPDWDPVSYGVPSREILVGEQSYNRGLRLRCRYEQRRCLREEKVWESGVNRLNFLLYHSTL